MRVAVCGVQQDLDLKSTFEHQQPKVYVETLLHN